MNTKRLLLIISLFAYTDQISPKVSLSRVLLCVKNKDQDTLTLKTSIGSPSNLQQLSPGQVSAYFVNPYYFFNNIQKDMLYLHFRPKLGAAAWITLTSNPPALYGEYENREQFMNAVGNRTELYLCSITTQNPTSAATCTIHSNFVFAAQDTPQKVCDHSVYP